MDLRRAAARRPAPALSRCLTAARCPRCPGDAERTRSGAERNLDVLTSSGPAAIPARLRASTPRRSALATGPGAVPLGLLIAGCSSDNAHQASHPARCIHQPTRPRLSTRLTLPPPTGPCRIGTVSLHLIDPSRPDPWVPANRTRQLMIQIWYPADDADSYPRAPYTTPVMARAWEKSIGVPARSTCRSRPAISAPRCASVRAAGPSCCTPTAWAASGSSPPPGGGPGWPRLCRGHDRPRPRRRRRRRLPDGQRGDLRHPSAHRDRVTTKAIVSRVADVRFVLDQLALIDLGGNPDHERRALPCGLRARSTSTASGCLATPTGAPPPPTPCTPTPASRSASTWTAPSGRRRRRPAPRPLLLFGRQDLDPFEAGTWAEFWTNQRGPGLPLTSRAPHTPPLSTSPSWWRRSRRSSACRPGHRGIGTINGERAVAVQRAYLGAYFDTYLRHHASSLLTGTSPRYPEVRFRAMMPAAPRA